jgi:hypothetical protein
VVETLATGRLVVVDPHAGGSLPCAACGWRSVRKRSSVIDSIVGTGEDLAAMVRG